MAVDGHVVNRELVFSPWKRQFEEAEEEEAQEQEKGKARDEEEGGVSSHGMIKREGLRRSVVGAYSEFRRAYEPRRHGRNCMKERMEVQWRWGIRGTATGV